MDSNEPKNSGSVSWWIASLAGSVVLCAIFAGYVFNIKEDLRNAKIRSEIMEQRVDMISSELDNLRRHMMMQQIQVTPSDHPVQLPTGTATMPETGPLPIQLPAVPQAAPPPPMPGKP